MKKIFVWFLIAVFAGGAPLPSFAAYGRLTPPSGWSQGGAAIATFKYASAATQTTLLLGRIGANAALTVAGSSYAVPVGLKLGATAALKAAEYSFGNPLLFVGILVGTVAYGHYVGNDFEVKDGIWKKSFLVSSVGIQYRCDGGPWATTKAAAASAWAASLGHGAGFTGVFNSATNYCDEMYGSIVNSTARLYSESRTSDSKEYRPATRAEFEDHFKTRALPDLLPKDLPEVDFPVDDPVVNPDPLDKSKPTPIWLPTGDPVKNPSPGTNPDGSPKPDTWTQPGVKVSPSPIVGDPWRVDIVPETKTKGDPSPNTEGGPIPVTAPPPAPAPEKELVTCGLPGKPKCQIDELDTPKPEPVDDKKIVDDLMRPIKDFATDPKSKLPALPVLTWSFQLPTGCTVLAIPAFEPYLAPIDICRFTPMFHDIMTMVWVIGGLFGAIGTFWRNTFSQN